MTFPNAHPPSPARSPSAATPSRPRSRPPCCAPRRTAATCWSPPRPAPARPWPSAWRWRPRCWARPRRFGRGSAPLGLVVAPTRELALQVQPRAGLALRAGRRPGSSACVGGMDVAREQRALAQPAPTSWSARRAACATTSSAATSTSSALQRRGARRGRRDARPRLPRGPRVHPRRHAGGAPHAAVLGHHRRARSPRWRERYQRDAVRIDTIAPRRAARRHRVPRGPRGAERDRARRRQRAALLREPGRAGVLRHPRGGAAPARQPARARLLAPWRCRAS